MSLNRVCIIGAGSGGLLTLRHLYGLAHVDLYDSQDDVGGQWNFSPLTESTCSPHDPFFRHFGYVPNSIYKELTTNLPSQDMTYMDFPHLPRYRSFVSWSEFQSYIKKFLTHHGLWRFIHLNHIVLKV